MHPEARDADARNVLEEWIRATIDRDPVAFADLFSRDPEPLVVWANGEVTTTWSAVRDHALRELNRGEFLVTSVDVHSLHVAQVGERTLHTVFRYDVRVRDLWGTERSHPRVGSASMVLTKDGWKFAAVHFSTPRPGPA